MANPIKQINGTAVSIKCPSKFDWSMQDISDTDAGRDSTGLMHKELIGYAVSISLEWTYITLAESRAIMSAFDNEYFTMQYIDPRQGVVTKSFYRGDISASLYSTAENVSETGLWTISFNVISRGESR